MRAAGPGSAARTCRTRWLSRRAYCWPTGGGELPTPAIWCGWMARSVGLRGRRRRARRSALRSGIHLRSREYSGRLGCRRCLSGRGGRTRSPSKRLRQTGLRRRQAGLVIPASAATVWSLIVRWVIVVSICSRRRTRRSGARWGQYRSAREARRWRRVGRVIVASAVGRRFCRPTVPTWLGPIRGAVWQSAGPLSASCSSSSISSRLNPWDYARLTDETTDTASARYRDSPENDRAGAASRSSARNSAASGR